MGGCYNDFSSNCRPAYQRPAYQRPKRKPNPKWGKCMKDFARTHSLDDLLAANKAFFRSRKKGFIAKLAEACDIKNVADIPKELPEIEYEVKFDITPAGKGEEPSIVQYLDAFDFPVGGATRFLKDPVNNFAIGTNHFIGDEHDERLVVIEKCGNNYVKEKGKVVALQLGIPYEGIVIKRTEARAPAEMSEVIEKIRQATSEKGVEYRGKIRKEKGDAFILDTNDGRIYSFTITRAHLTKAGEAKESGIQRQLEVEYGGYIPGFRGFQRNSEAQIVQGMIDLAKYTYSMYNNAPVTAGWRMGLAVTHERKYDFVSDKKLTAKQSAGLEKLLRLPAEVAV